MLLATITRQVCDICQDDGRTVDGTVLSIGIDGKNHEADICTKHRTIITDRLHPFFSRLRPITLPTAPKQRASPKRSRRRKHDRECPTCHGFFSAQGLRVHVENCQGVQEHVCPECNQSFGRVSDLDRHVARSHDEAPVPVEKKLQCPHCDASYAHPKRLANHMALEHPLQGLPDVPQPQEV